MKPVNPLIGKFDLDPGRWRPMWYGVEISVPVAINGRGSGSISIANQPFIMYRVTHQIIGCTSDPDTTGLYQDGQYTISWKDNTSVYQNIPLPSSAFFGDVSSGLYYEFPFPLPYAGNAVLNFEIYNRCARTLADESEFFTVGIVIHGIADWGPDHPGNVR